MNKKTIISIFLSFQLLAISSFGLNAGAQDNPENIVGSSYLNRTLSEVEKRSFYTPNINLHPSYRLKFEEDYRNLFRNFCYFYLFRKVPNLSNNVKIQLASHFPYYRDNSCDYRNRYIFCLLLTNKEKSAIENYLNLGRLSQIKQDVKDNDIAVEFNKAIKEFKKWMEINRNEINEYNTSLEDILRKDDKDKIVNFEYSRRASLLTKGDCSCEKNFLDYSLNKLKEEKEKEKEKFYEAGKSSIKNKIRLNIAEMRQFEKDIEDIKKLNIGFLKSSFQDLYLPNEENKAHSSKRNKKSKRNKIEFSFFSNTGENAYRLKVNFLKPLVANNSRYQDLLEYMLDKMFLNVCFKNRKKIKKCIKDKTLRKNFFKRLYQAKNRKTADLNEWDYNSVFNYEFVGNLSESMANLFKEYLTSDDYKKDLKKTLTKDNFERTKKLFIEKLEEILKNLNTEQAEKKNSSENLEKKSLLKRKKSIQSDLENSSKTGMPLENKKDLLKSLDKIEKKLNDKDHLKEKDKELRENEEKSIENRMENVKIFIKFLENLSSEDFLNVAKMLSTVDSVEIIRNN